MPTQGFAPSSHFFELPHNDDLRPNHIGSISQIVPYQVSKTDIQNLFVLGVWGFFELKLGEKPYRNLTETVELHTKDEKGDGLTPFTPWPPPVLDKDKKSEPSVPFFSITNLIRASNGHYFGSDIGVFYSPGLSDNHAFERWMIAANPGDSSASSEFENYSCLCGDNVANPPTLVTSICNTSQDDVILASSSDGIFRLKIFDYRDPEINPIFCWNRIKELDSRDIRRIHYVGRRKATYKDLDKKDHDIWLSDVWLMMSSSSIYRVESNSRSRTSAVYITDVTSLFRIALPIGKRPAGSLVNCSYTPSPNTSSGCLVVVFDDGIYSYDYDFSKPSFDPAQMKAARLLESSQSGLHDRDQYRGYFGQGTKIVVFDREDEVKVIHPLVFIATPTSVEVCDRALGIRQSVTSDLWTANYNDDEFITSIGTITRVNQTKPEWFALGLSTGAVVEYQLEDILSKSGSISYTNMTAAVPLKDGESLLGAPISIGGFEYVQRSNPPCAEGDRDLKDVLDAVDAILNSFKTGTPWPMVQYTFRFFPFKAFPIGGANGSALKKLVTGYEGYSRCEKVWSFVYKGDLAKTKLTLELLISDRPGVAPLDDTGRLNEKDDSENCMDKPGTASCDSKVGWARWVKARGADIIDVDAQTKGGKPIKVSIMQRKQDGKVAASFVLLQFKNWSHDRTRVAQINLIVN